MKKKLRELIMKGARGHTFMPTDSIVNYLIANNVIIQTEAYWIRHNWAEVHEGCLIPNYECPECGNWEREASSYCPDCGCKMKGVM